MLPRLLLALLLITAQGIGSVCGLTHAIDHHAVVHDGPPHAVDTRHPDAAHSVPIDIDGIVERCDACGSLAGSVLSEPRPVDADVPSMSAHAESTIDRAPLAARGDGAASARAPPVVVS